MQNNHDSWPDTTLVDTPAAAFVLDVAPKTLEIWRCTGRYGLRFVKVGRKVRYRMGDLRAFIDRRSVEHTGKVAQ